MNQFGGIGPGLDYLHGLRFPGQKLPRRHLLGTIKLIFLEIALPVFTGCTKAVFFEKPVEIAQIIESGVVGDQFDGIIRIE